MMASELEFYLLRDTYEEAAAKGWNNLEPWGWYNEDYQLLQATKAEPIYRQFRNHMTAGRHADRVLQGRSGRRPARDQHPLRRRAGSRRPRRALQARRQGDRPPQRLRHHLHGETGPHLDRIIEPRPPQPLGRSRRRQSLFPEPSAGSREMSQTMRHFLGGMLAGARELSLFVASNDQLVQALRGRLLGAGQHRLVAGQPHLRLPHRRQRAIPADREPPPRRRRQPLSRLRRDPCRRASTASSTASSRRRSSTATPT